ncbi:MAG: MCP four helix bundle domain-containing protein, partial [Planctomycetota bacterium]
MKATALAGAMLLAFASVPRAAVAAESQGDTSDVWAAEGAVSLSRQPEAETVAKPRPPRPKPTPKREPDATSRSALNARASEPSPAEHEAPVPSRKRLFEKPSRTDLQARAFDTPLISGRTDAQAGMGRDAARTTETKRRKRRSWSSSGSISSDESRKGKSSSSPVRTALVLFAVLAGLGTAGFLVFGSAGKSKREGGSKMRWTIGKKLVAAFLFVSGLVAVAGGVGLWGVDTVGTEADNIMDVQVPLADCSMEAEIALKTAQDAAGEAMTSEDVKDLAEHEQEIEDNVAMFDMFIRAIKSGTKDDRGEWTSDFTSGRVEAGTHKGRSFRALWEAENPGDVVFKGSSELASLADRADSIHEDFTRAIRGLVQARKEELLAEEESNKAMEDLDSGSAELGADLVELERHMDERFASAKKLSGEIAAKGTQEAKQIHRAQRRLRGTPAHRGGGHDEKRDHGPDDSRDREVHEGVRGGLRRAAGSQARRRRE